MSHRGTEDTFLETLFPDNMQGLRVVDVGHGYGKTGWWLRTVIGMSHGWCELYGIDIFPKYHALASKLGYYDELLLLDARESWNLPSGFFDISIAQHVIEHSEKEHAYNLIKQMEKHTQGRIIITTPYGYTPSDSLDGNEFNHHRSAWYPEDFEKLGYNVTICTDKHPSRFVLWFAKLWYFLHGKDFKEFQVIVAWKDVSIEQDENATELGEVLPVIVNNEIEHAEMHTLSHKIVV